MRRLTGRNATMTARVLAGETCRQVAADYGLTGARVLSITTVTFQHTSPQYRHWFGLGLARMRAIYRAQPEPLAGPEEGR